MTVRKVLDWLRQKWAGGALSHVHGRGGWYPLVQESYPGAWQQNVTLGVQDVLTYGTVWACVSLIARDIGKLWLSLVEKDDDGIWTETENSAYSPVLRKPNRWQNRIKFIECWVISKLTRGNAYILLDRDQRGVVKAMYVLDPARVTPLVAPDGSVFYQLADDPLSGLTQAIVVPAKEIIHDPHMTLYHPLVGVSPIMACGLAAMQGQKIQSASDQFFQNQSRPGGLLIAPTAISTENAQKLSEYWEANFTGVNAGRVAVIGDNMKYESMGVTAHDSQLVDQLGWVDANICACYGVPLWKISKGPMPAYGNVQAANIEYYSQALQELIECIEMCLDEGLDTGSRLGTEFDLDALLRMDSQTQMAIAKDGVQAAILSPNDARARFDLKPVAGGETPYMQEQNWPIKMLANRKLPAKAPTEPASMTTPSDDESSPDKAFDFTDFAAELDLQMKEAGLVAYV